MNPQPKAQHPTPERLRELTERSRAGEQLTDEEKRQIFAANQASHGPWDADIDDQVLHGADLDDPEIAQWRPLLVQAWQFGYTTGLAHSAKLEERAERIKLQLTDEDAEDGVAQLRADSAARVELVLAEVRKIADMLPGDGPWTLERDAIEGLLVGAWFEGHRSEVQL